MNIRLEKRTDYKEVEFLVRESFWNVYRPGCYEHLIIHNLCDKEGKIESVVTLGPVCVHPDYQRKGYGSKIVEFTLNLAKEMDIPYVFTIGDEKFYNRFGFEDASKFGLKFNDVEGETPFFMVKIFDTDKIEKINGTYKDNECFKVDEEELESFDKNFPPKKKEKREGQLDF